MKTHGGGVLKYLQETGLQRKDLLDFSASINPLGLPASVVKSWNESLSLLTDYPEIDAASLRRALAAHHQLPEAMILPANGSTSLIYLLPRILRPARALLVAPCFSEYRPALEQQNCQVDEFLLNAEDVFSFDFRALLESLHPQTDLVWLANPGNPTGVGIDPRQLIALAEALAPKKLVVDEAFVDFSPELSLVPQLPDLPNLILLRSMTKFYAIPGLRVGYLLAAAELVDALSAAAEPWQLSTPAIHAACACLADEAYRAETLAQIPLLRADFAHRLQELGFTVYPAAANYLFVRLPRSWPTADLIVAQLCEQGILVRTCEDFSGIDQSYLRLAVRSRIENSRLLDKFFQI